MIENTDIKDKEIWFIFNKDYKFSSYGRFISTKYKNPKFLKPFLSKIGYYQIAFHIDKQQKCFYVHRLLAQIFIPNPENKSEVNHIDGNKLNNSIDNLEWVTRLENNLHALKTGLRKMPKGEDHFAYGTKRKYSNELKKTIWIKS